VLNRSLFPLQIDGVIVELRHGDIHRRTAAVEFGTISRLASAQTLKTCLNPFVRILCLCVLLPA
jgi:hypothetical protein